MRGRLSVRRRRDSPSELPSSSNDADQSAVRRSGAEVDELKRGIGPRGGSARSPISGPSELRSSPPSRLAATRSGGLLARMSPEASPPIKLRPAGALIPPPDGQKNHSPDREDHEIARHDTFRGARQGAPLPYEDTICERTRPRLERLLP
jgi:hypothetical protein